MYSTLALKEEKNLKKKKDSKNYNHSTLTSEANICFNMRLNLFSLLNQPLPQFASLIQSSSLATPLALPLTKYSGMLPKLTFLKSHSQGVD